MNNSKKMEDPCVSVELSFCGTSWIRYYIIYSKPKLEKSKVTMQKVKLRVKWHPVIIKIKIKATKNNFQPFKTRSKQQ